MHLESSYQVYGTKYIDVTSFTECGPIGMKHLAGPYKAHLLLVFGYEYESDKSYVAYSAPCIIKRSDYRPVVGYVKINMRWGYISLWNFGIFLSYSWRVC